MEDKRLNSWVNPQILKTQQYNLVIASFDRFVDRAFKVQHRIRDENCSGRACFPFNVLKSVGGLGCEPATYSWLIGSKDAESEPFSRLQNRPSGRTVLDTYGNQRGIERDGCEGRYSHPDGGVALDRVPGRGVA